MPAPGLAQIRQDDFAAGMIRAEARHLISSRGLYDVQDGLLDDDGAIYQRGGTVNQSAAHALGTPTWLWDGHLVPGRRSVFATTSVFAVLDSDESTVRSLGGSGLPGPVRPAVIDGLLVIPGGTLYGGSRKTADYSTGTVTVTQNSKAVTGVGTAWVANVDAGMLFRLASRYYVVASVDSDTTLTLAQVYVGATQATQAYALTRLGTAATHGARTADHYAAVGGRLVTLEGSAIYFSDGPDPGTTVALAAGQPRAHSFPTLNRHELPAGAFGLGLAEQRDRLLVFTTAGLFMVSNLALAIVDANGSPQHRIEHISDDLILWHSSGIAEWRGSYVVPCIDSVWLLDGISTPVRLSTTLGSFYTALVQASKRPGGAVVFRSHLLLPILDSAGVTVEFLVCRLDRPVRTRLGEVVPWTRLKRQAGEVNALAVKVTSTAQRSPELLGVHRATNGRVLKLSGLFEPAAAIKLDGDAQVPKLVIETRDYTLGLGNESIWRRVRLRYELVDAASDDPKIGAYVSVGRAGTGGQALWNAVNWNAFNWGDAQVTDYVLLAGQAPETDRIPFAWQDMNVAGEFVRYRFEASGPSAKLVIRAVESFARRKGKVFA